MMVIAGACGGSDNGTEPVLPADCLADPRCPIPFPSAHRGLCGGEPENTLSALLNCERLGVPLIEVDTRETADGVVVIMHDDTVDRTTDGETRFPGRTAVDQLTRCAALELAPEGIRVNGVNPGVVVTNLHRAGGMDEEKYEAFLERSRTTHPLGRVGRADEVAALILFLSSDRASWITGETISIDGGRAQTCAR